MKILQSLLMLLFSSIAMAQEPNVEIRDDFSKFYEHNKLEGVFVLYDQNSDKFIVFNKTLLNVPFTPASTFKICSSLIGLETGVIPDENFVIPWDSVVRSYQVWNADTDLKSAFKNSTVWFYQELARRVGGEQMQYWLDKADYGNKDTSGGIDKFWLYGGLRITPEQQIDFLKKLYKNELPFSQRSMDIVKNIMVADEKSEYTLSGKTGWGFQDDKDIGWYVGFVETSDNVYYFANCIQSSDKENKDFIKARKDIVYEILNELGIVKNN